MTNIEKQVKALLEQIRNVGGRGWLNPQAPPDVKQAFLDSIHDCSDCQSEFKRFKQNS